MNKYACLLFLLVLSLLTTAHAGELALTIGKHAIRAEVADTLEAQKRGLMHRERLCADCGMLFVFTTPARYGFWMKDTLLPLSIAFIGGDGRIINVADMQANTLDVHYPDRDALYTLEMSRGWFGAHGIKPGDRVEGLPPVAASDSGARE
jgi:uncharacterized protein